MRIEGNAGAPVPVQARVGDDRLVLEVDGVEVGEWPVAELTAEMSGGGVLLRLGEDEVMIDVSDRTGFVGALAPAEKPGKRRRRRRPSLRLMLVFLAGAGIVTAVLLVPQLTGSVAILAGLLMLVLGAVAYSEPRVAVRLPLSLQALHLILGGMILVGLGVLVVLAA